MGEGSVASSLSWGSREMTREQARAQHCYQRVRDLNEGQLKDYKVLVNGLGPNIIRSGFAGALAFVQRYRNQEIAERFGKDLAEGLPEAFEIEDNLNSLTNSAFERDRTSYMLLTREILHLARWFKRAIQARQTS